MKTLIVIPARLKSSRLPEKLILDLDGKPVIQHVYERCIAADEANEVIIAVDSKKIEAICRSFTDNIVMTSHKIRSGTDRVYEVAKNLDADYVFNVQGDEPFLDADLINQLIREIKNDSDIDIISACAPLRNRNDFQDTNCVKVVLNKNGNALYFSRASIPTNRVNPDEFENRYKHIGIYGYRRSALSDFVSSPSCFLENEEQLEQLRALYIGLKIKMIKTDFESIGIDTAEDYELAQKKILKNKRKKK